MSSTGVVILCHGSRGELGSAEVTRALGQISEGVKPLLPGVEVTGAALQFNRPTLEEAVKFLVARGVEQIVVVPYFLLPGRHVTEHIPRLVEKLRRIYPERQFIMANPPRLEEHFITYVAESLKEAALEPLPARLSPTSPEDIERQSMETVEKLLSLSPDLSKEERLIVKHVVHASGDPQVVPLIRFSPTAISSGLSAMVKGSPIFTDVRMVAAGINRHLAEACRCSVSCAMDEAKELKQNITRTAAAMRHLRTRLNGAIVAIGNAPTALLALLDLVDNKEIKPALVIGMPVGFVQAREAKDELMKRNVPYISVVGTRGGSAMAVATVNALLKIAVEGKRA